VTNRYYIGMHSTDNLEDGYFGSGKRLWFSINYHGKENHSKEILEFLPTRNELKKREKEIVTVDLIKEDLCMNLQEGGGGGLVDERHRLNFINSTGRDVFALRCKEDLVFREKILKQLSINRAMAHKNGKFKYDTFSGKKHRVDTIQLMRESHKDKHVGSKNSQYGTCWITNDGLNKKIKKEDLIGYENEGWVRGRNSKS